MARSASLGEPTRLDALGRDILDQTVNWGDSRELLTSTSDFLGIAGSLGITPEAPVAMVWNTYLVEPAMLEALAPRDIGPDCELWGFPGIIDWHK